MKKYLLVVLFLACSACSHNSSVLKLMPEPGPRQAALEKTDTPTISSHQFHSVMVSPHTGLVEAGGDWRFYVEVKNNSALEVPFQAQAVQVSVNKQPLYVYSDEEIRTRLLRGRSEALKQIKDEQSRFFTERRNTDLKEDDLGNAWNPGDYINDVKQIETERTQLEKAVENQTRQRLADVDNHVLRSKLLKPNERYDSFIEFAAPGELHVGDQVTLRVGIEPDVHEFNFIIKNS